MATYKPGTDNVPIGKYIEVNEFGFSIPNAKIVTIDHLGERLPPTQRPNFLWKKL